jgi:hypothetical protein
VVLELQYDFCPGSYARPSHAQPAQRIVRVIGKLVIGHDAIAQPTLFKEPSIS